MNFDIDGSSRLLSITAIDKVAQFISGLFGFNVENSDAVEVFQITSGDFNNIEYSIQ
ncbi:hypothetical protein JCM19297_680 [Nonlabens ulvanivorans]|nr:hypothetical protein [Nonlabens ulvanivorans]GAK91789.1 hypothetical protein JCM19297_680 [Nonlabens ulvanivorans]